MHADFIKPSPAIISVYRGQYMSMKELNIIRENIYGRISMNTFLSTSATKETALAFIINNYQRTDLAAVLFQIDIDSTLATKPFANIKDKSYMKEEDEVLLAMGSTFSINKVEQDGQGIWNINLVWENQENTELIAYMKKSLGQSTNLETLGTVLINMDELYKADRYFKLLLDQLPSNHPSIADIYLQMNTIALGQSKIEIAIEYLDKAEKIIQISYPPYHPCYGSLYYQMGRTKFAQLDLLSAQSSFEKAAEIFLKTTPSHDIKLAAAYVQAGYVSSLIGESSIALDKLQKALEIQLVNLPTYHPEIGVTYQYLGSAQLLLGRVEDALHSFTKALEIYRKSLSPSHRQYLTTCLALFQLHSANNNDNEMIFYMEELKKNFSSMITQNIGDTAFASLTVAVMNGSASDEEKNAFAARIQQMSTPWERAFLELHQLMQEVDAMMKNGDYDSALKLIDRALLQCQQCLSSVPMLAACMYFNKASIYFKKQDFSTALSSIDKAIEVLPSNHPMLQSYHQFVGDIYREDGTQKMNLGELDTALVAYIKAVNLYITHIQPPMHESIAQTYGFIGDIYVRKKEFDLAMVNLSKARNSLPTNLLVPQHYLYNTEQALAYLIYKNSIRHMIIALDNEALEGFRKALSIFVEQTSSPSYEIATVHFYIGYLCTKMTNKSLAEEHFRFAINSAPSNHPVLQIVNKTSSEIEQKTLDLILADLLMIDSKQFEVDYVPRLYEKAISYYQQYPIETSQVKLATVYLRLGSFYQKNNNDHLAKKYLNDAYAVMPPDSENINETEKNCFLEFAEALSNYATHCMTKFDFDTAFPLLNKSLRIYEMFISLTDPRIIIIYRQLAGVYAVRLNIPLAKMYLEKVVANPINQEMYEENSTEDEVTVTKLLTNTTEWPVEFNIVSYQPKKYTARPSCKVLEPNESFEG
ncbi:unnamed protein product [Rotaria sordida]|uniref:MSP domain-containing protein n=1 Tax=Rotaria sordida TaxID=392033 RepID=A0A819DCS6_9BILA|nr:unnamed protein product [Rotaria sordida]